MGKNLEFSEGSEGLPCLSLISNFSFSWKNDGMKAGDQDFMDERARLDLRDCLEWEKWEKKKKRRTGVKESDRVTKVGSKENLGIQELPMGKALAGVMWI